MKLLTLNIWGAKQYNPFMDFVKNVASEYDIICFQEVFDCKTDADIPPSAHPVIWDIYDKLCKALPNFKGYFEPAIFRYGQATFVKNPLVVTDHSELVIHDGAIADIHPLHRRTGLCTTVEINGTPTLIINVHGLWNKINKKDSPERIVQSNILKSCVKNFDGPVLLCGDFNLEPDTESIRILEKGMTNLITKYGITCTRSSFYIKPIKFADYVLVNSGVVVSDFKVLDEVVSDHLALSCIFDVK